MRARHALASMFVAFACLALAPHAHSLEPPNASSLVTLIADQSTPICPATTTSHTFGDRLLANGRRIRFTVPTGQVLVITALDWAVESSIRFDETGWAAVDLFDGSGYQHAFISDARFDLRGRAAGNSVVPNGVAVGPGTTMCLAFDAPVSGATAFARIHGFLARDE